ncbi:dockerin type I domain-containing protein [Lacipirellula sp.]|uniref:dockerin type I domain-containing protein n=1 Tax=Lacipirellula sp. TaxID=2691419 RepID=UPI003D0D13EC
MKLSQWYKVLGASLVACGMLAPEHAQAINIPLADPSFEAYVLTTPGAGGYAYSNKYVPTSAWIGRPGADNYQNAGPSGSNWIYSASYAEAGAVTKRPAPRTGTQAMHGRGHMTGQKLATTFEAGATYTFSVYAQGDNDSQLLGPPYGWQSRIFLNIYDASLYGNDIGPNGEDYEVTGENSLTYNEDEYNPISPSFTYFPHDRFAPSEPIPPDGAQTHPGNFVNRPNGATAAQSQAAWQKISISHLVLPGSPEVGKPIGVAFQAFLDGAVDDASLTKIGPGDLNGDFTLNALDWNILRTNQLADLTSMPVSQSYFLGDLNGDGQNNHADFLIFKTSYDASNGAGAFVAMVAAVPEPSAALLAALAGVGLLVRNRKK